MLTRKQYDLLTFIHGRIQKDGVPPSFDEMKEALDLKSKSGIHRLITALEERGYIRRLPHRARALEVTRLPENMAQDRPAQTSKSFAVPSSEEKPVGPAADSSRSGPRLSLVSGGSASPPARETRDGGATVSVPIMGWIAAGSPIEAIENKGDTLEAPSFLMRGGEHFALEIRGDSMIEAGIHNGDMAVIRKQDNAQTGEIVVALVDGEEATLKRLRKKGASIALEAANPAFETRVYGSDRVSIQGKLVGLIRAY